jgi:basic amino acid/polyamine antiporter, APA family
VVTFVYVGANIGYHMCLPISETRVSKTIAADVFETILGRWGVPLAAAGVMISMFGALNSNLLAGPRIYFAMARDGLFPRAIGRVHPRFQTPANAVLAQSAWSLLQIAIAFKVTDDPKGAFDVLTDFVVLGGTIFYALVVAAVMILRWRMPKLERPYKTHFYPLTPIIYLLTALLVVGSMFVSAFAPGAPLVERMKVPGFLVLMVIGFVLYWLFRRLEQRSGPSAIG